MSDPPFRREHDGVWALPPVSGVLGAALVWYLSAPLYAAGSARLALDRQLALWRVPAGAASTAGQLVEELVAHVADSGGAPLLLEAACPGDHLAIALRPRDIGGWNAGVPASGPVSGRIARFSPVLRMHALADGTAVYVARIPLVPGSAGD